jgi:hypothetical protein
MSKLALLFLLAVAPLALTQDARVYAPAAPEHAGETTILNTSIVKVDGPGRTITVRADGAADGAVDRNRTRLLAVDPSAAATLAQLKAGSEVLLTLRGGTVVDIKLSAGGGGGGATPAKPARRPSPAAVAPASRTGAAPGVIVVSPAPPATAGPQSQIPQLPPGATSPTSRSVPQLPAGANPPQARPVPQVAPSGGVIVITGSPSPTPGAPTRPAVSPVAVGSPRSPGTPRPVILPSDPPPTPIPSPAP